MLRVRGKTMQGLLRGKTILERFGFARIFDKSNFAA